MTDVLKLTPNSNADIANKFLARLEEVVNNKTISGLLITEKEAVALLNWVIDLESEILSLREAQND